MTLNQFIIYLYITALWEYESVNSKWNVLYYINYKYYVCLYDFVDLWVFWLLMNVYHTLLKTKHTTGFLQIIKIADHVQCA